MFKLLIMKLHMETRGLEHVECKSKIGCHVFYDTTVGYYCRNLFYSKTVFLVLNFFITTTTKCGFICDLQMTTKLQDGSRSDSMIHKSHCPVVATSWLWTVSMNEAFTQTISPNKTSASWLCIKTNMAQLVLLIVLPNTTTENLLLVLNTLFLR